MRYLHVSVAGEEATLHPLVPTLTDEDLFRDARMMDWSPSFDPPRMTALLYLDGDLDRFEAVLDDTDLVLEYDVTPIRDGRGYAYVHSEPHPTEWQLLEIATGERLIPVFPVQYHDDGTLSVRIVGPTNRLQAAVEATPSGVEASIEKVGGYDVGRPPIPPSLSARQREAIETAFPRRIAPRSLRSPPATTPAASARPLARRRSGTARRSRPPRRRLPRPSLRAATTRARRGRT